MTTKEFTIGEMIDAIEKDGLKQAYRDLFVSTDSVNFPTIRFTEKTAWEEHYDTVTYKVKKKHAKIDSACALGQGYINLGVRPTAELDTSINSFWEKFTTRVFTLNDVQHLSLKEIAKRLRKQFKEELNIKFSAIEFDYEPFIVRNDQ